MSSFLITVRDKAREIECTTTFEDQSELAARDQSIAYYAAELERPASALNVVAVLPMLAA